MIFKRIYSYLSHISVINTNECKKKGKIWGDMLWSYARVLKSAVEWGVWQLPGIFEWVSGVQGTIRAERRSQCWKWRVL